MEQEIISDTKLQHGLPTLEPVSKRARSKLDNIDTRVRDLYIRHGKIDKMWMAASMHALSISSELFAVVLERAWPLVVNEWTNPTVVERAFELAFVRGLCEPTKEIMFKILSQRKAHDRLHHIRGFLNAATSLQSALLSSNISSFPFPQTADGIKRWCTVFDEHIKNKFILSDAHPQIQLGVKCFYRLLPTSSVFVDLPLSGDEKWVENLFPKFSTSSVPYNSLPFRIIQTKWNTNKTSELMARCILAADLTREEDLKCVDAKVCSVWNSTLFLLTYERSYRQIPSSHSRRIAQLYEWTFHNNGAVRRPLLTDKFDILPFVSTHHPHLWIRILVDSHRLVPLSQVTDVDICDWPAEAAWAATQNNQDTTDLFQICKHRDGALWEWWNTTQLHIKQMLLGPIQQALSVKGLDKIVLSFVS